MPAQIAMTRDPLPGDVKARLNLGGCPICHRDEMTVTHSSPADSTPTTRSVEPDEDGTYLIQPHRPWCPAWTGETPRLACPRCGAPIEGIEVERGAWLKVAGAGPNGQPGHIEATPENLARYGGFDTEIIPAPDMDVATVTPCGDVARGSTAHDVIRMFAQARQDIAAEEAAARIAVHAELLTAARASGADALVDAYEAAERASSKDAPGLLAAIRLATP
jgi:hypothetical protein